MIKERIIEVLDFKGFPKEKFYAKIGMTSANFRGKAKLTPINSNAIENILSEIPEINLNWLITGEGKMLTENNQSVTNNGDGNSNIGSNINGITGNVTISHNDFSNLIDMQKSNSEMKFELIERLKECQNHLSESQNQVNILLEILKKK